MSKGVIMIDNAEDLKEKAIKLSGIILEFSPNVKKGEGEKIAEEILEGNLQEGDNAEMVLEEDKIKIKIN